MKKRYQIEQQRAVQEFRQLAREENPNLQMIFPMTEVVGLLQEGVGHLMREAGLALMSLVMEEEVRHLAGERHEQHPARRAHRWGKEAGYCVVDGQKVPIQRTRLRSPENREQRLGSYELFQRRGPMEHAVWDKMMRGLSTRNYGAVVKDFHEAYGVEKSAVSDNFIASSREKLQELMERPLSTRNYGAVVKDFHEAYGVEKSAVSDNFIASSREKLQELMERPLGALRLCTVLIDGTPFRDRQMIVALGINIDGRKTVLGLREGATENAAVVSELLSDLAARGLDFSVPRLYVLDGGKALAAAVRRHAGEAAFIQRCQVHKRRNGFAKFKATGIAVGNQHVSVPTQSIGYSATRMICITGNLTMIVDCNCLYQFQTRVGGNQGVQVNHRAVFPQE